MRVGSFSAGGRLLVRTGQPVERLNINPAIRDYAQDPNGTYLVEQAYVQFFIPEPVQGLPILLLHGGGLCGSCWETTPDGRAGWLSWFLSAGRPVYLLDDVERGRAGFVPSEGALEGLWNGRPLLRTLEEAWRLFRLGPAEGFADRTAFDGCRFPSNHMEALGGRFVPRWPANHDLQLSALEAAVTRIGPCTVVAHSQGCLNALRAAAKMSEIRALALLEPAGFPQTTAEPAARPDCPVLQIWGDFLERHPLWSDLYRRGAALHRRIQADGGDSRFRHLPSEGVPGNSHLLMMDDNAEDLAGEVVTWIAAAEE